MKKNFKFMLVALMALFSYNAMAQDPQVGDALNDEEYYYEITKIVKNTATEKIAEVKITALNGEKEGEITIDGSFTKKFSGNTWTLNVVKLEVQVFKDQVGLTKVNFPAELRTIDSKCFQGCTLLSEITFPTGSQLTSIQGGAFATTQITNPDFSNCLQLTTVKNYIFTEGSSTMNSYVKTIKLPNSPLLTNIGKAFANLPLLTSLNVNETQIQSVEAEAFANDAKLISMQLPGTVKTIKTDAFKGSAVESLEIDLTSIGTAPAEGIQANVYGEHTTQNPAILLQLLFKNNLKGTIATSAFAGESKIGTNTTKYANSDILNLENVNIGTTGQIQAGAFGVVGVKEVKLGNIENNTTGAYAIQSNAFVGGNGTAPQKKLATVSIKNITTNGAIAEGAFGNKLKKVSIGNVYAESADARFPIAGGAFVFDNVSAELTVGNVRSTNHNSPVMAEGAFNFDAVAGTNTITIEVGAVEAKGGNFSGGVFANTKVATSITFKGAIEQNGIDVALFSVPDNLKNITFNGTVAENGIGATAFSGANPTATSTLTVNFNAALAPGAVAAGAFTLGADPAGNGKTVMTVNYDAKDHGNTFLAGMPWAQTSFWAALVTELNRDIVIAIKNNDALKTTFENNQSNTNQDVIFRAKFKVTDPENYFEVYNDNNNDGTSYARIVIPAGAKIVIDRRPTGKYSKDVYEDTDDQSNVTYTLYTIFKEEDEADQLSTLNMMPMVSTDGFYYIDNTVGEDMVVIVKATGTEATDNKITKMWYEEYDGTKNSVYYPGDASVKIASKVVTNQQLRDRTGNPYNVTNYAAWVANPADATAVTSSPLNAAALDNNNVFLLSNPAKFKGLKADVIDYEGSTKPFINIGNFYALGKKYGAAAPARMIIKWIGEDEATAIIEAKTAKAANSDAIYNLQGVRVNGTQKGVYIQNGKKFIVK